MQRYLQRSLQQLSSAKSLYRLSLFIGCLSWLVLMAIARGQSLVPVEYLTRDPATIADHPEYYGALSNIGVLLWNASAVVCLMGALQIRAMMSKVPSSYLKISRESSPFLASFGILSGILCLDDLFLLHESIIPNKLNLSEEVVFISYGIALMCLLIRFRRLIVSTGPGALLTSLLIFAISITADKGLPLTAITEQDGYLIEDGLKLLAIFLWLAYFVWITLTLTTAHTHD
ncbi:MAG: hypothetical protein AAF050_14510 [Cyanobacteria bacterium J06649_5]